MVPQKKESESEHSEEEDNNPTVNHNNPEAHSNHVRRRVTNVRPSSMQQEKENTKVTEEESNTEHSEEDDDEKEWNELQKEMKQKKASKINYQSTSWPVHAPFFPEVSYHRGNEMHVCWALIRKSRRCGGFMCVIVRRK